MKIFRKLSYNKPLIDTCEAAKNVEIPGKSWKIYFRFFQDDKNFLDRRLAPVLFNPLP